MTTAEGRIMTINISEGIIMTLRPLLLPELLYNYASETSV